MTPDEIARGNRIVDGLKEAVAFAKGEGPAASITVNGHTYVHSDALRAAEARGYEKAREQAAGIAATMGWRPIVNQDHAGSIFREETAKAICAMEPEG